MVMVSYGWYDDGMHDNSMLIVTWWRHDDGKGTYV